MGGRAVRWAVGKVCPAFISEAMRCRKFTLERVIGKCAVSWCDLDLPFDLAIVALTYKILFGAIFRKQ